MTPQVRGPHMPGEAWRGGVVARARRLPACSARGLGPGDHCWKASQALFSTDPAHSALGLPWLMQPLREPLEAHVLGCPPPAALRWVLGWGATSGLLGCLMERNQETQLCACLDSSLASRARFYFFERGRASKRSGGRERSGLPIEQGVGPHPLGLWPELKADS